VINYDLARRQNLSPETITQIEKLQAYREELGRSYAAGKIGVRMYEDEWTANEFDLQDLWGFTPDKNYHMFWTMEGCTCPKMDNRDAWGTPYHVYNGSCPIHGSF
jgi:hypothetical protein